MYEDRFTVEQEENTRSSEYKEKPAKKKHTGVKIVLGAAVAGVLLIGAAGAGAVGVIGAQKIINNTRVHIESPTSKDAFSWSFEVGGDPQKEASKPQEGPSISEIEEPKADESKENREKPTEEIRTATQAQSGVVATDISSVVEEVMPAMVSIVNNGTEVMDFWGQRYEREIEASGTGIIVSQSDEELLIVTNHHVAVDSSKLSITFIDGTTAEARIKGMDSQMDLAVLAVDLNDISDETRRQIVIARLGDSQDLKLGKPVIVIGNALGYGQSVTTGIISGLNRELVMEDGSTGTFIQTDAAVNPGNSGGALFNVDGEVIGIVSSKIGGSTVEGMGYAIPISSASPIISEMMERKTRGEKVDSENMGYLGVKIQEITQEATQYYNMPAGIFVYEVLPDSGAMEAGIIKGDIIVRVEGERTASHDALINVMQYYKAGDTISVVVCRQEDGEYKEIEMQVTLGTIPEQ